MRVPWNEDMRVKFPATVQFMRLGYEYQSLKDADNTTAVRRIWLRGAFVYGIIYK